MEKAIFKCYSGLDTPERMLFINSSQIKKITPNVMPDGRCKLFVNYYDDEWCLDTMLICENIIAIDIETDSDYQIWKNS